MTNKVIDFTSKLLPNVLFESGNSFFWSPKQNKITYNQSHLNSPFGAWSLLHRSRYTLQ